VALTDEELAGADIVVVVTAHHAVDYARVARLAKLVLDTANAVPADAGRHVARLGAPEPQGAHTEVPVADD
jgi:UDP-N-acetyl-D-mannosaminuronate dehydrogenase